MSASSPLPLDQQVVVITGASSGVGLCTARLAAARGARVVLVARSGDVLYQAARDIDAAGGRSIAVPADVASREQLEAAAQEAVQAFGRIDTWINNAGVSIYGRLDTVTEDDSQRLFATNFWGVVNGSLVALPYLEKQGGALINVGSAAAEAPWPLQGMYACSKLAVQSFTDTLRVEVEEIDRSPVRITLIQPSAVNTPHAEHAANYLGRRPMRPTAMLDPIDVADTVLRAATEGGRDLRPGAGLRATLAGAEWMPSPGDTMAARPTVPQPGERPAHASEGALYHAGKSGRTHGHATA
jgi:NADP-dependent 3-hydroxy acid dehydrogenase YdfG